MERWIEIGDPGIFERIESENGIVPLDAFISINNSNRIVSNDVGNDDEYIEQDNVTGSMHVVAIRSL